jgi:hypothetical protein
VPRMFLIAVAVTALLAGAAAPAGASAPDTAQPAASALQDGWVPVVIPPFDAAAGVLCDFAVHYDAVVNHARTKVVATYPDGSPKRQLGVGALFLRLSNAETGASKVVDTSDSVVTDFGTDGSRVLHAVGPVIALVRDGTSNLPRGIYAINGIYRITVSPAGFKTFSLEHATTHPLCPDLA